MRRETTTGNNGRTITILSTCCALTEPTSLNEVCLVYVRLTENPRGDHATLPLRNTSFLRFLYALILPCITAHACTHRTCWIVHRSVIRPTASLAFADDILRHLRLLIYDCRLTHVAHIHGGAHFFSRRLIDPWKITNPRVSFCSRGW